MTRFYARRRHRLQFRRGWPVLLAFVLGMVGTSLIDGQPDDRAAEEARPASVVARPAEPRVVLRVPVPENTPRVSME